MPSLEGEAHGENGAEEHREPDDEGEDDGVLAFDVQRRCKICKGDHFLSTFSQPSFTVYRDELKGL